MLSLYSDASFSNNIAVATSIIFDEDGRCIAFFPKVYQDVPTSAHGEIIGVVQGLEWVVENRPGERVAIYCDHETACARLCLYPEVRTVVEGYFAALWLRCFSLLDKLPGHIVYHISAHQSTHNPNKTCDILCSKMIRHIKDVLPLCTQS